MNVTGLMIGDVEKFKAAVLTKDEICEACDLLICVILIKTGTRPGVLENTQLQHYKTLCWDLVNADPVMLIPEDKPSVDGPAMLALDGELVGLLATCVEHIHPQFLSLGDDYPFLPTSGKRFNNGTINRRLQEM